MGYFSNATEAERYQAMYCFLCINWRDPDDGRGEGCPIWDMQLMHNQAQSRTVMAKVINEFIPRNGTDNEQCTMFVEVTTTQFDKVAGLEDWQVPGRVV